MDTKTTVATTKPASELIKHFGTNPRTATAPATTSPAPAPTMPKPKPDTASLLSQLVQLQAAQLTATREIQSALGIVAGKLDELNAHEKGQTDFVMAQTSEIAKFCHAAQVMIETASATPQAAQPVTSALATNGGSTEDVEMHTLLMSYDDKGKPTYKMLGGKYGKFGVRVWPEVLPLLQVNADELKPGPNLCTRTVRVAMKVDESDGTLKAQKVVGLAAK